MDLTDEIWSTLDGGYRNTYDASVPLRKLESATDQKIVRSIFNELWDNLHHQGDVGLASYLSVPSLVEICMKQNSLDWNFIGLCLVIDDCRRSGNNRPIPHEFSESYFNALNKFEDYLLHNFKAIDEPDALRLTLAFFANMHKQFDLGKAIKNLDEDVLKEFLERY